MKSLEIEKKIQEFLKKKVSYAHLLRHVVHQFFWYQRRMGLGTCALHALNKIMVKNHYPLPHVDDFLDQFKYAIYFTKLDLRDGYHQVVELLVKLRGGA